MICMTGAHEPLGSATPPIACTLDSDAMADRMTEFAQLFGDALVGREPTPDGIRFRFAAGPGVEDQIRDLARREQTCCSFFSFAIEVHDREVWWDATGDKRRRGGPFSTTSTRSRSASRRPADEFPYARQST